LRKIKLLILVPTMELGGMELCTSFLLSHLNRELFEIELVMVFDRQSYFEIPSHVRVHVLEKAGLTNDTELTVQPSIAVSEKNRDSLIWLETTALNLAALVRTLQPDLILAQHVLASAVSLLAKRHIRSTIKIIASVHNFSSRFLEIVPYGELYALLLRRHLREADAVVAIGQGIANDLIMNFDVDRTQVRVIYNPFDYERVRKLSTESLLENRFFLDGVPNILFVGGLRPEKGLEYLLQAIALSRRLQRLRCVIIGEGERRTELEELAKQLGISSDTFFLGRRPNAFKYMRAASCFVLPSLVEGYPYVVLEAMACGCPVIASESGPDVQELLGYGQRGLLVPARDPEAISDAIQRIVSDTNLRENMIEAGKSHIEKFTPISAVAQYEALMKAVVRSGLVRRSLDVLSWLTRRHLPGFRRAKADRS